MTARVCTGCTTVYAVGAPRCPHCQSTESVEQGEPMPKITRHGGPTIAGAAVTGGAWSDSDAPDEWPEPETAGVAEPTPAEAAPAPTPDDGEQDGVAQTSEPEYEAWTVEQLKDQLDSRGLAKTGKKEELVNRLYADDTARAAESDAE